MSTNPPSTGSAATFAQASVPGMAAAESAPGEGAAMAQKWSALHEAAALVQNLAGIAPAPLAPHLHGFPAVMRDAAEWRLALAEQGVEDLAAIMEAGLAALLALHSHGGNPAAAARSLWLEFDMARAALLELTPPPLRAHQSA